MSSEAWGPAEAAGSVSGTEGRSGRTKVSAGGLPAASGFSPGPGVSKEWAVSRGKWVTLGTGGAAKAGCLQGKPQELPGRAPSRQTPTSRRAQGPRTWRPSKTEEHLHHGLRA